MCLLRFLIWLVRLLVHILINILSFPPAQIIGTAKVCFASETSTVDPGIKKMTLKTINMSFHNFISINETMFYEPHPTDASKTLLRQEATVTVKGVPLSHYMEDILTSSISTNAGKGRQGLEWVINKINTEVSGRAMEIQVFQCGGNVIECLSVCR